MIFLVAVLLGLYITLDLNKKAQAEKDIGLDVETLDSEIDAESARQIELKATLEYVQSDEYVAVYAREEGGLLLPNEKRVVPLIVEATPEPPAVVEPTPDPGFSARSWQAWWKLLTDAPLPGESE
jgi:hypothetical protein